MVAPLHALAHRTGLPALGDWLEVHRGELERVAQPISRRMRLVRAKIGDVNAYVKERHYLQRGRTMAQVGYWIVLDVERAEDLEHADVRRAPPGERWLLGDVPIAGALLFALPRVSRRLYGYHPMELLELARLFVEPGPGGKNPRHLAGAALGAALRRVRHDWHETYERLPRPRAVVSWSDDTRHEGVIYRAAGFVEAGASAGRTGQRTHAGAEARGDLEHPKTAWMFPWAPPDAFVEYVLVMELMGVTREGAREVCDLVSVTAASIGLAVPANPDRRCAWYREGPSMQVAIPLEYARGFTGPQEALGDLVEHLGLVFYEATGDPDVDYVEGATSETRWRVIATTPDQWERVRKTGRWEHREPRRALLVPGMM